MSITSLTLIRWLKKIILSFAVSRDNGSEILTFILNLIISHSSPIVMSSEMWNLKKNFPSSFCLSITYVLIDSITTASIDGCLKRKFSNSTFLWAVKFKINWLRKIDWYIYLLTEREEFFVVIDSFARVRRLFECGCLQVSSLSLSHSRIVKHLKTCVGRAVWIIIHVLDIQCLGYSVFMIVTGLDPRNHRLLFGQAPLMLTIFWWNHRRRLPLQHVFVQPRHQPTIAIFLGYLEGIGTLFGSSCWGCTTCRCLTVLSNSVLHEARALIGLLIGRSPIFVIFLLRLLLLTHVLLHTILVEFEVQSIGCRVVLLGSLTHDGLAVVRFIGLACAVLLQRCLTAFHFKQVTGLNINIKLQLFTI